GGIVPFLGEGGRGSEIGPAGFLLAAAERGEPVAAMVERGDALGDAGAELGQPVGRYAMLARQCAQREEAFLDLLEAGLVAADAARRRLELRHRLARLDLGPLERRQRGVEPAAGAVAQPLELAERSGQRPLAAALARELGKRR